MRDRSRRMEEIRRQISRYRSRYEKRMMVGLAAVCIALSGGIGILLGMKQQPGMLMLQGGTSLCAGTGGELRP